MAAVEQSPLRDRMIFLVGARRSGTNWLQRIIATHPAVASLPTETFLFRWLDELTTHVQHGAAGSFQVGQVFMERSEYIDALRQFCDAVFGSALRILGDSTPRLLERTPKHADHLALLGAVYPDARIVHIVRDGRDVARSLVSQEFGPDSVAEAADEWRVSVGTAQRVGATLEHYAEVRYEDLLAEPAVSIRKLFADLDLDAPDDVVATAVAEARVPYNVDPHFPAVEEGKWRQTFSSGDLRAFEQTAGETLAALGYQRTTALEPAMAKAGRRRTARAVYSRLFADRGTSGDRALIARQTQAIAVFDRLLDALARQDDTAVQDLLSDTALVRVIGPGAAREGRGDDALAALRQAVLSDIPPGARQTRGDVHPGAPTVSAVIDYELPDGRRGTRIVVAVVDGERISRLSYYWRCAA